MFFPLSLALLLAAPAGATPASGRVPTSGVILPPPPDSEVALFGGYERLSRTSGIPGDGYGFLVAIRRVLARTEALGPAIELDGGAELGFSRWIDGTHVVQPTEEHDRATLQTTSFLAFGQLAVPLGRLRVSAGGGGGVALGHFEWHEVDRANDRQARPVLPLVRAGGGVEIKVADATGVSLRVHYTIQLRDVRVALPTTVVTPFADTLAIALGATYRF